MTHELGTVQQTILSLAVYIRRRKGLYFDAEAPDVYTSEVMAAHYGFEPDIKSTPAQHKKLCFRSRSGHLIAHNYFHPERIGMSRYDSAKSAIRKAIKGLRKRGVVSDDSPLNKGIYLTGAGWDIADGLPVENFPQVNR